MSYFVCPKCGADNVEFVRDVRMVEYYNGDDVNVEEDVSFDRGNGFVSIECSECGEYTEDPVELENWVSD